MRNRTGSLIKLRCFFLATSLAALAVSLIGTDLPMPFIMEIKKAKANPYNQDHFFKADGDVIPPTINLVGLSNNSYVWDGQAIIFSLMDNEQVHKALASLNGGENQSFSPPYIYRISSPKKINALDVFVNDTANNWAHKRYVFKVTPGISIPKLFDVHEWREYEKALFFQIHDDVPSKLITDVLPNIASNIVFTVNLATKNKPSSSFRIYFSDWIKDWTNPYKLDIIDHTYDHPESPQNYTYALWQLNQSLRWWSDTYNTPQYQNWLINKTIPQGFVGPYFGPEYPSLGALNEKRPPFRFAITYWNEENLFTIEKYVGWANVSGHGNKKWIVFDVYDIDYDSDWTLGTNCSQIKANITNWLNRINNPSELKVSQGDYVANIMIHGNAFSDNAWNNLTALANWIWEVYGSNNTLWIDSSAQIGRYLYDSKIALMDKSISHYGGGWYNITFSLEDEVDYLVFKIGDSNHPVSNVTASDILIDGKAVPSERFKLENEKLYLWVNTTFASSHTIDIKMQTPAELRDEYKLESVFYLLPTATYRPNSNFQLWGYLKDENNETVPSVSIKVTPLWSNETIDTTTSMDGYFNMIIVTPPLSGEYEVKVLFPGDYCHKETVSVYRFSLSSIPYVLPPWLSRGIEILLITIVNPVVVIFLALLTVGSVAFKILLKPRRSKHNKMLKVEMFPSDRHISN